jgi:hypothetical protein
MTGSPEANVRLRVHVADIVARASFMRERQDTTYYTDVANISETTVQERLDRLLAAVARGNRDAFNRWLQWNELDIAGLRRVVQDIHSSILRRCRRGERPSAPSLRQRNPA